MIRIRPPVANSISITPGLSATGGRDAGLGHDCGLIERRRNLRPMKQASVPSADQGDEAAGLGHRPDNAPKSRQDLVQPTAHGVRGCRNRLIERRLSAVRECSAPQSRDVPLRIEDYCLAAMLVLGMFGAAAARIRCRALCRAKRWSADPHRSNDAGNPGQGQDSDVLRQRQGGPRRHDDECRTLVVFYGPEEGAGATKAAAAPTSTESQAAPACRKEETSAGPKRAAT